MSKLLFDEQPLVVSRELAKLIGLNESIVLQQVHYWLEINRKADKNFHDGRYWTYNTMKSWQEKEFAFWSFNTVKRTFTSLVNKGYLILGNYNHQKFDQTKWYSIDYEALETLISPNSSNWANAELPISPKWANASGQNEPMDKPNLGHTIPETNTENNNIDKTTTTPKGEKEKPASGVVVVDTYEIRELILKYLKPERALSEFHLTKIGKSKGFSFERLERILQVARSQDIRSVVGYLVKAIENPDFDFSVVEAAAVADSAAKPKSKIANYNGRTWDYEHLAQLAQEYLEDSLTEED